MCEKCDRVIDEIERQRMVKLDSGEFKLPPLPTYETSLDGGEIGTTVTPKLEMPDFSKVTVKPEDLEDQGSIYDPYEYWRPKVQTFEDDVRDVYEAAEEVLLKKHQDYGPKNISLSPGGPLNGLRVRMHDKLARVNNLIESGAEPENESLRDSFLDLMNYSAIAMLVLDGNWPES